MPLPSSLLARLQRRGIVKQDASGQLEEVFAENYDENEHADSENNGTNVVKHVHEVADCPNTDTKYHECTEWCVKRWGVREFTPLGQLEKKRARMLHKYPLPAGWVEVGDPLTGRCYYWNLENEKVSWLSPIHPRAKITVSAEKLQSTVKVTPKSQAEDILNEKRRPVSVSLRDNNERLPSKRRRAGPENDLDPMDPAAYSEIERGGWSAGLRAETKTGVDTTANGPLFQQRPYPSPGDILRAQAAAQKE